MTVRAAWLLPGGASPGQTREDTRLAPVGTYTPASELTTRPGVIPGGSPFAATAAGVMTLQIGTGRAMVQGTAAQGAYPVAVTSPETLTFPDGHAQFARIDSVVLRVYDGLYDASGQTLAAVEILGGEPTATPTPPALPAGSLRLWDVTVPAGTSAGTSGITWGSALADRRQYTTAIGGITPRSAGTSYSGAYDGQYRDTGTGLERWSASAAAWQSYPAPPAGWLPYTATLTNTTLGNGNLLTRYRRYGTHVEAAFRLAWGSTTTGAMPRISMPVTPASLGGMRWTGNLTIHRGSGNFRAGTTWLYDDTSILGTGLLGTASSQPEILTAFAAAGVTMAAGGWIIGNVSYEAAG
ncbi:hypothetical protein [Streptomyces niveiscabiei]|uniref:Minor tail protein n=1 Tax=Streptomyces niveiscabiei TaxID=164115 RepID=A0ABW9I0M8_9ACTN